MPTVTTVEASYATEVALPATGTWLRAPHLRQLSAHIKEFIGTRSNCRIRRHAFRCPGFTSTACITHQSGQV